MVKVNFNQLESIAEGDVALCPMDERLGIGFCEAFGYATMLTDGLKLGVGQSNDCSHPGPGWTGLAATHDKLRSTLASVAATV